MPKQTTKHPVLCDAVAIPNRNRQGLSHSMSVYTASHAVRCLINATRYPERRGILNADPNSFNSAVALLRVAECNAAAACPSLGGQRIPLFIGRAYGLVGSWRNVLRERRPARRSFAAASRAMPNARIGDGVSAGLGVARMPQAVSTKAARRFVQ
jgi:hypothetical protein